MGAKTWMLVLAESNARKALAAQPRLDREATQQLVNVLFPGERFELLGEDGDLSYTCPPDDEIHIGCFPGVSVIAAKEFANDYPSKLPQRFIAAGGDGTVMLHAMHSVVDWFAYAVWKNGSLQRALSLSPDSGILEDIGPRLDFEQPYWEGAHPVGDGGDEEEEAYPLPFHPLELGEEVLKNFLGYQLEGYVDASLLEPETVSLLRYRRVHRAWWKFWL